MTALPPPSRSHRWLGILLGGFGWAPRVSRTVPTATGRRHITKIAVAAGALALGAVTAGCGTVASGGETSGNQEFVDGMAAQLSAASSLAYTAVYSLNGGGTGTIAQQPSTGQASYTYPTGMTLVTNDGATVCPLNASGSAGPCTVYSSVDAAAPDIARGGLIRPESVVTMLSTAALDRDAIVSEHDSTIAGTSAACITITSGSGSGAQYDTCVTPDGLLGSFQGTWDGAEVDVTMVSFSKTVSADAFKLPAGARVAPAASASPSAP
ncbi:MAG TPA: hypothetical protein VKB59_17875 [Micromonosporaceae bacterium]|nr:hypothetical protein [Micromonosporaceae bacterium]